MRRKDREVNSIEDVEEIINKADVCRVAFAENDLPYIVTMNFGYRPMPEPRLYFHCAKEGRKIEMMKKSNLVCFEMDTDHVLVKGEKSCDWGMKYSSVVGYGKLRFAEEEHERIEGMDSIMSHYGANPPFEYGENIFRNTVVLCLEISDMTGKKKI
jgi:uncharacterized protein